MKGSALDLRPLQNLTRVGMCDKVGAGSTGDGDACFLSLEPRAESREPRAESSRWRELMERAGSLAA